MNTDEALAPLREPKPQLGWRDPAGVRSLARRRRRCRRAVTVAATAIVIGGVLAAVTPSRDHDQPAAIAPSAPIVGAVQAVAHVTPLATRDDDAAPAVSRAEQQFAIDLLKRTQTATGNSVLSPVSLAIALAMLQTGARGTTETQIASVLHTSRLSAQRQDVGWAALVTDLASAQDVTVESANSLWAQRDLPLKQAYLDALARYFRTGVWRVDFGDPSSAARSINQWTSNHTNGKITKLFDRLSPNTALVLANAIYFKAAWQQAFDPKDTSNGAFHQPDGSTVTAPFMRSDVKVSDQLTDDWQSAQIPYAGGRYSAVLVMPTEGTLAQLVAGLTSQQLTAMADTSRDYDGALAVPKFELSTYTDLGTTLKRMGMRAAFDRADFSGLSSTGLAVTQVVQRDYLKVDESGTEAAAVTGIAVANSARAGLSLEPFDHPFLFLVRDKKTGAIVFSAQINDPTATS